MSGTTEAKRYLSTCHVTGKRSYEDRNSAKVAKRKSALWANEKVSDWNQYRCEHCDNFHIGHRPYYRY